MLRTPYDHIVALYHGGRDLGLRNSSNTDHSNHFVIQVIQSLRSLRDRGERQKLRTI